MNPVLERKLSYRCKSQLDNNYCTTEFAYNIPPKTCTWLTGTNTVRVNILVGKREGENTLTLINCV